MKKEPKGHVFTDDELADFTRAKANFDAGNYYGQVLFDKDETGLVDKETILIDFRKACSKASYHFADDTGKEWGAAQSYVAKAKDIASANPEFMTEYLEILKDQLVSQSDIFGY